VRENLPSWVYCKIGYFSQKSNQMPGKIRLFYLVSIWSGRFCGL
jgi:hypothetical protein